MADLEEVDYFIHCHPVVFLLLLDKHVMMFSRKGIEEDQVMFLLVHCQLIISLEIIIQLEENLVAFFENLQGQITRLYNPL